jgi:hypothetical protein
MQCMQLEYSSHSNVAVPKTDWWQECLDTGGGQSDVTMRSMANNYSHPCEHSY